MSTAQRAVPKGRRARNEVLMNTLAVIIRPTQDLTSEAADKIADLLPLGLSSGARERLLNTGTEARRVELSQRTTEVRIEPEKRRVLEMMGVKFGFQVDDRPGFDPAEERTMRKRIADRSAAKAEYYRDRRRHRGGSHSFAW